MIFRQGQILKGFSVRDLRTVRIQDEPNNPTMLS
jgi:hypothetical protein